MKIAKVFLSEIKVGDKFVSYGHIKVKLEHGSLGGVSCFNFHKKQSQVLRRSARVIPYNWDVPASIIGKVMGST